ncbi:MAG TPA: MogA/MoaB family molybdenum cofactor biosynthesis protein [Silvibacterium sp.]|nr:MogA/MoaB family molybdenum cofactor biosynthesis protein [Silvibacterium sp.]
MTQATVITVSDSCSRGEREDLSGPAVARELEAHGFDVQMRVLVPDERKAIEDALREAAKQAGLVVTTGGTGIAPRDVTPEATRAVCDRLLDGVAEAIRAEGRRETRFAALGRGVCGTMQSGKNDGGGTLVLNLPGSPRGAVTSLKAVLPLLEHAVELLAGKTEHTNSENGGDQD